MSEQFKQVSRTFFMLSGLITFAVQAQVPSFRYKVFHDEEVFQHGGVLSIFGGADHRLFINTTSKLYSFDGAEFYDESDRYESHLTSPPYAGFQLSDSEAIWMGIDGAGFLLLDEKEVSFVEEDGWKALSFRHRVPNDSTVWNNGTKDLFRFDRGKEMTRFSMNSFDGFEGVLKNMEVLSDSTLLLLNNNGELYLADILNQQLTRILSSLEHSPFRDVRVADDVVYLSTVRSLYTFSLVDSTLSHRASFEANIKDFRVGQGQLWVLTEDGQCYCLTADETLNLRKALNMEEAFFSAIHLDDHFNVWAGLASEGILLIPPRQSEYTSFHDLLDDKDKRTARSLMTLSHREQTFLSDNAHLYRWQDHRLEKLDQPMRSDSSELFLYSSLALGNRTFCFYWDRQFILSPPGFIAAPDLPGLYYVNYPVGCVMDTCRLVVYSFRYRRLDILNVCEGTLESMNFTVDQFMKPEAMVYLEDSLIVALRRQRLWLIDLSQQEVSKLGGVSGSASMDSLKILAIFPSQDSGMLVLTERGVHGFDHRLRRLRPAHLLFDETEAEWIQGCQGMMETRSGEYLGNGVGALFAIRGDSLELLKPGNSLLDGSLLHVNPLPHGDVLISSFNGVTRMPYDSVWSFSPLLPPSPKLGLSVLGHSLSYDDQDFEREENNLRLEISTVFFSVDRKLEHRFKLEREGESSHWNRTDLSSLEFVHLEPGEYQLQVASRNDLGPWSSPAMLSFSIQPYLWETTWFRASLLLVLVALGAFGFYLFFQRRLAMQQARVTILMREKKLEQQALQAMMNPHFVFNAMNSIRALIEQNTPTDVSAFISKFARLVRLNMENAGSEFVLLQEELDRLRLYMELEQERVPGSFSYSIQLPDALDPAQAFIPSMIIQPFVENAIIHGIMPLKDRDKRIEIRFTENSGNHLLKAEILDNGVGMASAKTPRAYPSRGVSISENRLKLMTARFGIDEPVKIHSNNHGKRGTHVEVWLPVDKE